MAIRVRYEAFDRTGSPVTGVMEAASEQAVEEALWTSGLVVSRVRRIRQARRLDQLLPTLFGPGPGVAVSFARQLSTMLDSGFPLLRALEVLNTEQSHPGLRDAVGQMMQSLSEGGSFSSALGQHPTIFPAIFVRLAGIGEETGELSPLLRRAADYVQGGIDLKQKVRSSLTYPVIVALTSGGAIYVLLTFSIPMLAGLLAEFEAQLPLLTRIIINAGVAFNAWIGRVALLVLALVLLYILTRRTSRGRLAQDRFFLLHPPLGSLLRRSSLARMAQSLAALLQSGILLRESVELTMAATDNAYFREALGRVRQRLLEGISFSDALRSEPLFSSLLVEMVHVGENTGALPQQLTTLQSIYQQEFENAVNRIVGMLEPVLILLVGGLVGVIGVTIITTVYSVLPAVQGG